MGKLYDLDVSTLTMGIKEQGAQPVLVLNPQINGEKYITVVAMNDSDGPTQFLRHFVYNSDETIESSFDTDLAGASYTVVGTVTLAL